MRKTLLILLISIVGIAAKAQDYSKWGPGYYYDLDNVKHTGIIKWDIAARSLFKGDNGDYA